MNFDDFPRVEYKKNSLFEVVFQARFPEIMKISNEEPVAFQDIIRKEGYPESISNNPALPEDMPSEVKKLITASKHFTFLSEEKDWHVSLAKDSIALTCKGNYLTYSDFRKRVEKILNIFSQIYEPSYFSRIGLRYLNMANNTLFPLGDISVRNLIPEYIFPELKTPKGQDTKVLEKTTQLDDGNIKINLRHTLATVSGNFQNIQINDEESYIVDIDCFSDNKIQGVDNVLNRCDEFKCNEWNIFQWSITDSLRQSMGQK